jgi:hypothetical protein
MSVEPTLLRATYCVSPRECTKPCDPCRHNRWVDLHTCRWCNALHKSNEPSHDGVYGHFCGFATNSICEHLFVEWLARRNT